MLGRGLISNPGLAGQIVSGSCTDRSTLRNFFDELVLAYREEIPDEKNVVFKIKENLFYLVNLLRTRRSTGRESGNPIISWSWLPLQGV